ERDPPGPWMYAGALENWPRLVGLMARRRPLWGNDEEALRRARSPIHLRRLLAEAGIPSPRTYEKLHEDLAEGRWLVKPRRGSSGVGIHFWDGKAKPSAHRGAYYQEHVEGTACAAVYVAGNGRIQLLGVTRQLIGESWVHAAPFRYCGSIGPLTLPSR